MISHGVVSFLDVLNDLKRRKTHYFNNWTQTGGLNTSNLVLLYEILANIHLQDATSKAYSSGRKWIGVQSLLTIWRETSYDDKFPVIQYK